MTYAPVIIPTLNRYEHFYQCLESLEHCTGAEQTDVYVGLDFPPSDKYVDGWKKIDAYLAEKEKQNGFKRLIVIRRTENRGLVSGKKFSNMAGLFLYVMSKYDALIASEDDNVFSPNFLEYINKGLTRYEDDPSVLAIVGYAHPYHFKHADNNHYRHNTDMSVWGYGIWKKKHKEMSTFVRAGGISKMLSLRSICKVYKHGWLRLYQFLLLAIKREKIRLTDSVISVYLILTDRYVIVPTLSKVRNIGWDLDGNSFKNGMQGKDKIAERHNSQPIDTAEHFDYVGDDHAYMDYNNTVAVKESDGYMSFFAFVKKTFESLIRGLKKM